MTDIVAALTAFSERFNTDLEKCFPAIEGMENRAVEAMKYSVMNGGKRLRPYLLCECAALFGVGYETAFPAAASLEMLHSYSLIHDDLPAMDNDDLRRGKPTCHKQFDEATAILAGDGLLTYAFEYLSTAQIIRPEIRLTLVQMLSDAAGAFGGMVSGQTLDLYAGDAEVDSDEDAEKIISRLEEMKTGRLLRYACEAGAVLGKAPLDMRRVIVDYSRKIGQAFQIADDILDREGDPKLVGKTLHKDESQNKFTFVSQYGIETARQKAKQLVEAAISGISVFGSRAENLQNLARYIIERNH
ncbi:MAG: polyprenyl synthetase family protein [Alphaproteobacteria bacterium]|nr:polyprenyl synthetase family protein [Alphaproteobacteria bacterium]